MSKDKVRKVNPQNLTLVEAAVIAGVSDSYIGDLIRNGKLERPLTVESVREWAESRKRVGSTGKAKWYHVRCTPEQYAELVETFGDDNTRDPGQIEKDARERKADEARAALTALGLDV